MKVKFDGDAPVYHPATGLQLQPGENEVTDEQGAALIAAGICKKSAKAAGKEK